MIKFKSFSSGSCGNCYFLGIFPDGADALRSGTPCEAGILIDAGVSPRRLKKELGYDGLGFDDIGAMLITHDHMDHIRSLGSFCKHVGKPVWATSTLHRALSHHTVVGEWLGGCARTLPDSWTEVVPGRIRVRWFEVPHDATQTVGYAVMLDDFKFVLITDSGRMTDQAMAFASQADTVVIESNYDPYMLAHGPYPPDLQARIRGGHGHMSNQECADALARFAHEGLRNVFLCHLSEHNNTPELALKASREVADTLPFGFRLAPLPRQSATPLINL